MKNKALLSRTALTAGALAAAISFSASAAPVTEETAKNIALENAGQKAEDVTFLKLKSDIENNRRVFEVKFLTTDQVEYDYEILESDGTILSIDYDISVISSQSQGAGAAISMEQAKTMALEQAKEKTENVTFVKEETDYDYSFPIYEMEFHTSDSKKYKYEFNGNTGAVISWEYDGWGCLLAGENTQSPDNTNSGTLGKGDAISGMEGAKSAALKKAGVKDSDVIWKKLERDRENGRLVYKGEFVRGSLEYEFEIDGATGEFLEWDVEMDD